MRRNTTYDETVRFAQLNHALYECEEYSELKPVDRECYAFLAERYHFCEQQNRPCRFTPGEMAKYLNVSKDTVRGAYKRLEIAGLLDKKRTSGNTGYTYTIHEPHGKTPVFLLEEDMWMYPHLQSVLRAYRTIRNVSNYKIPTKKASGVNAAISTRIPDADTVYYSACRWFHENNYEGVWGFINKYVLSDSSTEIS